MRQFCSFLVAAAPRGSSRRPGAEPPPPFIASSARSAAAWFRFATASSAGVLPLRLRVDAAVRTATGLGAAGAEPSERGVLGIAFLGVADADDVQKLASG